MLQSPPMAPRRSYKLNENLPPPDMDENEEVHPLVRQLLFTRGIRRDEEAEPFLRPDFDSQIHDPFLLTDMEKAVNRILQAIEGDEHIAIYSDYDCDGIPGGVVLHDLFEAIGFKNFENYIPHRHEEGYGFNAGAVSKLEKRGTKLIITVDCGIVDHEAATAAKASGIDVIITDHHEPGATLPNAFAVINPKRDDAYPFKGLCGAAVAWKLAQAVLARGRADGTISLPEGQEKWWLDMVGLATIADMVPLTGENRVLATYGIQVLRKSRRPGLQHLLRRSQSSQQHLTEDDIGFTIAPRINAASRMDDPEDAFHMLRTKDESEAGARVLHLERLNNERKGIVASMTKEAKRRLHTLEELPPILVLGDPEWRPSLVGLVATSLAEEYGRPSFLWGRDGGGILKGSCRSGNGVSTLRLMEAVPHAFIAFGGHHASGGFSVAEEMIHGLKDSLVEAYLKLPAEEREREIVTFVDAVLTLDSVDHALVDALTSLAPFGEGNPKPLFRFDDAVPFRVMVFGKTQNHTKLTFKTNGVVREAVAFFKRPDEFHVVPEEGKPLTLIAHIERSYFMGRMETRLKIVDIV